jgi:phage shock protein PspC (stress-responsive transcriptional regulator)
VTQFNRLHRSNTERVVGGVCGGLAESFGGSPWLYRVIVVGSTIVTQGAFAILYLLLWTFLPTQSRLTRASTESALQWGTADQIPTSTGDAYQQTAEMREIDQHRQDTPAEGPKPMDKVQDTILRMTDDAVGAYQRWRRKHVDEPVQPTETGIDAGTTIEKTEPVEQVSEQTGTVEQVNTDIGTAERSELRR